jgi:hypothetical protein
MDDDQGCGIVNRGVVWCPVWVGVGGHLPLLPGRPVLISLSATYLPSVVTDLLGRLLPLSVSPLSLCSSPCSSRSIPRRHRTLTIRDARNGARRCAVLVLPGWRVAPDVPSDYSLQSLSPCAEPSRTLPTCCISPCNCMSPVHPPASGRWRDTVPCRDDDPTGSVSIS